VGALDMDGVLDDIERGRVDRQKIQALAIINPDGHAAIIDALKRHGEEHAAELTHQQEVALSILTGQPIGAIMQPRTIRGFQQAHATSGPPPEKTNPQTKPIGNPSGAARSPTAMAYQSGSDRMEADNGT
jgi:hypothetical protein